jgi:hypothetical protein
MAEPSTRTKLSVSIEKRSPSGGGEEKLLVAALAAAMVEYRRYVAQRNGKNDPQRAGSNWRMMARVEQLRG